MKSDYPALSRLEENPPETISELRTLEANCAASYFRRWVGLPIKWMVRLAEIQASLVVKDPKKLAMISRTLGEIEARLARLSAD
jgi:hypothetical protein